MSFLGLAPVFTKPSRGPSRQFRNMLQIMNKAKKLKPSCFKKVIERLKDEHQTFKVFVLVHVKGEIAKTKQSVLNCNNAIKL